MFQLGEPLLLGFTGIWLFFNFHEPLGILNPSLSLLPAHGVMSIFIHRLSPVQTLPHLRSKDFNQEMMKAAPRPFLGAVSEGYQQHWG